MLQLLQFYSLLQLLQLCSISCCELLFLCVQEMVFPVAENGTTLWDGLKPPPVPMLIRSRHLYNPAVLEWDLTGPHVVSKEVFRSNPAHAGQGYQQV
jgi:hypothetical protein